MTREYFRKTLANRLVLSTFFCKNVLFIAPEQGSAMMRKRALVPGTEQEYYPYAGIYFNRVAPTTINSTHLGSTDELVDGIVRFQNLQRGIVAIGTDINLSGFTMDNIHRTSVYARDPHSVGAGIYASDGAQVNIGGGYQIPHLFQNTDIGIKMEGSTAAAAKLRADLYPSGLYMQDVKYGIIAADNTTLDITGTTIKAKYRGIAIGPDRNLINKNATLIDCHEPVEQGGRFGRGDRD